MSDQALTTHQEHALRRGRGEVILIGEASAAWLGIASTIRSHMLSLPPAVAQIVAPMTDVMAIRQKLEAAVHEALDELSKYQIEIEADEAG